MLRIKSLTKMVVFFQRRENKSWAGTDWARLANESQYEGVFSAVLR